MLRTEAADEVLLAYVASDPEAFAVFYRRHEDRMLRYFLRRGATAELAADLTAEVFAAALVAADRFEPGGPAEAWLMGSPATRSPQADAGAAWKPAPAPGSGWHR